MGIKLEIKYARGSNLTYDEELEKRASHWGKGFPRDGRSDNELQQEALDIAIQADIVIAVMGEAAEMSGESTSRTDLNIPDAQKDLLKKLVKTGKPVITCFICRTAVDISLGRRKCTCDFGCLVSGDGSGLCCGRRSVW